METLESIEDEVSREMDRLVEVLSRDIKRTNARGVIVAGPVAVYYSEFRRRLVKGGINVVEDIDKAAYGNGEGWYFVSVEDMVKRVVCSGY